MAYVVLARKYRPTTFAQLVGQDPIVRTLNNAMTMDRVHHAFLLTGARGVGKTTTARLLAKSLNCAEGPTISPCGACLSCQELAKGASGGVIEIDGASHTGVDNVRELRESARYVPQVGRFKIYIVDEVHMLSQAAFNALLKLLEEPPAHVKFVFATTEPHKIPATILSRCQRFDFRRLDVDTLAGHLAHVLAQEQVQVAPAALQLIARQAGGSVRDALSLLDQVLSYAGGDASPEVVREALGTVDGRVLFTLTDAVVARDAETMLQTLGELETQGHDLTQVAELFVEHLRDVAVAQAGVGPRALAHRTGAEIEELRRQAACRSAGDWQRLFDKACDVVQAMRGAQTAKVALEMGLLRLMHVAPAADLTDLLRRVDALLAALPEGGGPGGGGSPVGPGRGGGQPEPALEAPPAPSVREAKHAQRLERAPEGAPVQASERVVAPRPATVDARQDPAPAAVCAVAAAGEEEVTSTPEAHPASAFVTSPTLTHAPELTSGERNCGRVATADDAAGAGGEVNATCGFRAFVERVRRARPSLASVLEHGQLVHFGADEVVVAFAPETFWWDAVTDPENRTLFEAQLQQQLAAKVSWRVVPRDAAHAGSLSLAQQREAQATDAWEKTRAEAADHEAVRAATHILGAAIEHIRPATPA